MAITIDPITRLEGHFSAHLEAPSGVSAQVSAAYCSSHLYRGFENILRGRRPNDAVHLLQRICGVCPVPHGTAAVHATENAMGWAEHEEPTTQARLMRNLTIGAEFLHSTLTHFYALSALDYVQGPPMPPWMPYFNSAFYHPLLVSPVQSETSAVAAAVTAATPWAAVIRDYVTALHMRRNAHVCGGLFSGSQPHAKAYVAGGVTHRPTVAEIDLYKNLLYRGSSGPEGSGTNGSGTKDNPASGTILHFIENNYIPLTTIVAFIYNAYDNSSNTGGLVWSTAAENHTGTGQGMGKGCENFLSYGGFHTADTGDAHLLASGVKIGETSSAFDKTNIYQSIGRSFYSNTDWLYPGDANVATQPNPDKSPSGYASGAYTWHKAPRYKVGATYHPMEVGPLARMIINGDYVPGNTYSIGGGTYKAHADSNLSGLTPASFVAGISTMDRHRARALEARKIARACADWLDNLQTSIAGGINNVDTSKSYPSGTASATLGVGLSEAPRGSVGHWTQIRYDRIERYEVIAPTSWNGSGRDTNQTPGPIEQALEYSTGNLKLSNVPSSGKNVPVEALRVVHSFDPCIACAVHLIKRRGGK